MNLDDLTLRQIKEIQTLLGAAETTSSMFEVGASYLIRTVTHIFTGEVIAIKGDQVQLKDAAWIADTGRFYDCLSTGKFNEVEPYPTGMHPFINQSSIIDACEWPHELPREQK